MYKIIHQGVAAMGEFQFDISLELIFILRLFLSSICGMLIGWEREKRMKSAGLRTHMVVAMAASLMMIISKYGFLDVVYLSSVQVDVSRMASGVVQAIGFLGAGVIFVRHDNTIGVTTASGLWTTVGIGLALGSGLYILGIVSTAGILLIQSFVHKKEDKSFLANSGRIEVNMTKHNLVLSDVRKKLEEMNIEMRNISLFHNAEGDLILKTSIVCSRSTSLHSVLSLVYDSDFIDSIDVYSID